MTWSANKIDTIFIFVVNHSPQLCSMFIETLISVKFTDDDPSKYLALVFMYWDIVIFEKLTRVLLPFQLLHHLYSMKECIWIIDIKIKYYYIYYYIFNNTVFLYLWSETLRQFSIQSSEVQSRKFFLPRQ